MIICGDNRHTEAHFMAITESSIALNNPLYISTLPNQLHVKEVH